MSEEEIEIMIEMMIDDLPEDTDEMTIACIRDELKEIYGIED